MEAYFALIQIEPESGNWKEAEYEKIEGNDKSTMRETLKAVATLLNKRIRVVYPNSILDDINTLSGSYIHPSLNKANPKQ